MNLSKLAPALLLLASCGKDHVPENEAPINALAISRVSNLLADRETYWWTTSKADTVRLYHGVQYGVSVAFYYIHDTDTIPLTQQVLSPHHEAFLFWETSASALQLNVKGGQGGGQGLTGFLMGNEAGGLFLLQFTLRYQADTVAQTGEVVLQSVLPVIVE